MPNHNTQGLKLIINFRICQVFKTFQVLQPPPIMKKTRLWLMIKFKKKQINSLNQNLKEAARANNSHSGRENAAFKQLKSSQSRDPLQVVEKKSLQSARILQKPFMPRECARIATT